MGGQKNNIVKIRTEVDRAEVDALKTEIAKLDGDEVRIRAAVDKSSLRDIDGLTDYAVSQSKNGKSISFEGVSQLNNDYIAKQAHGYAGVNAAINQYKLLVDRADGSAEKFAETIGKGNVNLGKYLKGLNGAKAGIIGYGVSLVGATAKTIALEVATTAMNAAISMGVSLLVQGLISGVSWLFTYNQRLEESRQEMIEAGKEAADTGKKLSDLAEQYKELAKSQPDKMSDWDNTKINEARNIQEQIKDLIGEEVIGLDLVNGKLSDKLDKLKQIRYEHARDNRNTLDEAKDSAGVSLTDVTKKWNKTRGEEKLIDFISLSDANAGTSDKKKEYFNEIVTKFPKAFEVTSGSFMTKRDLTSRKGMLDYNDDLKKVLDYLNEEYTKEVNEEDHYISTLYDIIDERYDEVREKAEAYRDTVYQWSENEATFEFFKKNGDFSGNKVTSKKSAKEWAEDVLDYGGDKNDYKNFKKEIYALAVEEFPQYGDAIKGVAGDLVDLSSVTNDVKEESEDSSEGIDEVTNSIEHLKNASEKISSLSTAFNELSDNGYITTKTLSELQTATGLADDKWAEYENRLLNAKKGSADFNQALSELTYKILENEFATIDLTNATDEEVTAMESKISAVLRENNIANHTAIAQNIVGKARAKAKIETLESGDAIESFVGDLANEADQLGLTEEALFNYILQENLFNSSKLKTKDKIENLQELAKTYDLLTASVLKLNTVDLGDDITLSSKSGQAKIANALELGASVWVRDKNGEVTKYDPNKKYSDDMVINGYILNGQKTYSYKDFMNQGGIQILSDEMRDLFNYQGDPIVEYRTKSVKEEDFAKEHLEKARDYAEKVSDIQEDLAEKEADFAEKMADAWKEEHLEQLKDDLEKRADIINRYKKSIEIDDFGLDFIEEDDFLNKSNILTSKLSNLTDYGKAMREEFDRVANIIPQTGDEAQELANRLESLGSEMRDNVSKIRETTVALQKLSIDMATTIVDTHFGRLQSEMDNIDRRIKILSSDYRDDYGNSLSALNMDMFLPVYSDYEKVRREKQREDQALIDVTQETQDEINEIVTKALEMQSEENAKAREKERQNLIKDMEEARQDAQEKLAEAHQDYLDFLEDNDIATTKAVQDITDTFANADISLPEVDITSIDDAIGQIRTKLDEIFEDYKLVFNTDFGEVGGDGDTDATAIGGAVVPGYTRVSSPYGYRTDPATGKKKFHAGTDYAAPKGTPIYAYSQGVVELSGENGGYGNCVIIDHGDGRKTLYAHASKLNVRAGENVAKGQKIAEVGSTGKSTGAHLHFEYRKDGKASDPSGIFATFATGTLSGNAQAKHLGIAGENYKPEILIDKASGKKTYIDSPTIIDTSKTDVVGEKQTAKLPKFATGTPMADEKYLKEIIAACDAFDIPYNIALSLIDQESANGTAADTWRKNSVGAVGLTQITPSALGDFRQNSNSVSKEIVAKLLENGVDFENSRTENESAYRDNIWTGIANLRLIQDRYGKAYGWDMSSWANALGWYYAGGGYKGTNGQWYANQVLARANTESFKNAVKTDSSAIDATSNDVEDIKETVKKIEYDLDVDYMDKILKATTKEEVIAANQSRNEKIRSEGLDETIYSDDDIFKWWKNGTLSDVLQEEKDSEYINRIESFYTSSLDKVGQVTMKYRYEFQSIENNESLDSFEKSQQMYDVLYRQGLDVAAELSPIKDFVNTEFENWMQAVNDGTKEWSLKTYNAFVDTLAKISDAIFNYEDKAVQTKQAGADAKFDNSQDWISDRIFYNDWNLFGDSEIEAWERVIKWLNDEYPKELDKIKNAEKNLFEARKRQFEEANNFSSSVLDSQKTILQSYYDVTNSIAEAQHEINKELETSKTMYEWLDEDTRKLLFNQKDYNKLNKELNRIEKETLRLRSEYQDRLNSSTPETIENITSQYKMQYETLMKSYEIAKADLEIAKKKQQLNNVLNERNVRMFINGQWQWVANTEDVVNAKSELADAKYAKQVEESGLTQKKSIDALTIRQNELNVIIKQFENGIINLNSAIAMATKSIGDMPQTLLSMYSKAYDASPSSNSSYSSSRVAHDVIVSGLSGIADGSSVTFYTESGIADGSSVTYKKKGKYDWYYSNHGIEKKLANGTRHTQEGLTLMGEEEPEMYITASGHLIPINQPTIGNIPSGGIVFNAEQMRGARTLWDMSNMNFNHLLPTIAERNQTVSSIDNSIHINGMTVDSGSADGQALVRALRRYVGNH